MSIVQNILLAIVAAATMLIAAPASAKDIRDRGKRVHYAQQPADQQSSASNRWGLDLYHWRFGDHYFDGI
jgi:hypothetical protein